MVFHLFSVGFCSYAPLTNFIASETQLTFQDFKVFQDFNISTFQDFQVLKCATSSGSTKTLKAQKACIYGLLSF